MLEIGSLVDDKYKILNVVGKGGMSVVYLAMNEKANKQWAIKEIRKDGTQDYEVVKQNLIVETELLKKLNHKNLPSIIDVIDEEDTFLIVMDYIEGVPLSVKLKEEGAQPQELVIEWAKQLCSVLGYLHTRNSPIIYRDLKPSNIMLKPDGSIVLIDFGTARTFKETSVEDTQCLGTKGYAAPEQYGGKGQTDARTDIYCLGATIYHLITGHSPCDPPYQMYPIRQWDPNLSAGLEYIIDKCVKQNPAERYQTCAELMYEFEHYDELDLEYRQKQNKKLGLFATSAVICILAALTAIVMLILESSTKKNSYDVYLEEAQLEVEKSDAIAKYQRAINLEPSKGMAYLELLNDQILDDDILTSDEAYVIRDTLNQNDGSGKTNEDAFKSDTARYDEFAYRLGVAYFYTYEDAGNKSLAKKWLEDVTNSTTLEASQIERAKRLSKIAGYYSKIGQESKSGDASISYADYWQDLIELTSGNIVEKDNTTTALIMYKELIYQIYTNGIMFKNAGITKEEMQKQIENVEKHLETDFGAIEETNDARAKLLADELRANITLAEQALESAFTVVEKEDEESKNDK